MDNDYIEQDDEPRKPSGCVCGGDMPGRCPGRENCPACVDEMDDDVGQQANGGGQRVSQSFYIAPNDTIYSLQLCDSTYTMFTLRDDDEAIFRNRHLEYFRAN